MKPEEQLPSGSWASSAATRKSMRGNRRRDTSPEWRVRRLLHARGLRYRVDLPLPFDKRRRADITFPRARVVVFIDGCFWHGCPRHYAEPKTHTDYWAPKIAANRARDAETTARLEEAGWTVLRFWEHEDPETVAARVAAAVAGAAHGVAVRESERRGAEGAPPPSSPGHGVLPVPHRLRLALRRLPWPRTARSDPPAGDAPAAR